MAGKEPAIIGLWPTPPTVGDTGGYVTITGKTRDATSCVLSAVPAIRGLPETLNCTDGIVSDTIKIPANTNTTSKSYDITLSAMGLSTATATTVVQVAGTTSGTPLDVSGPISVNTTWSPKKASAYVIEGSVSVPSGVTLTIAPGTVVKSLGSGNACSQDQANLCVAGTLDAVGTSSEPVIFTSENDNSVGGDTGSGSPAAGDWAGITIASHPASIDLENAVIEYDGLDTNGGIVLQDPNPSLRDDAVENVLGVDYLLDSYGPFDNISDVTGSGAGNPVLDLAGGEVTTTTLNNEPIPWFTGGPGSSVSVPSGVTLTIAPGTVVKSLGSGNACSQDQANLCVAGTLDAVGTSSEPVIFTSENDNSVGGDTGSGSPAAGDWAGITIASHPASIDLENAVIEYDGLDTNGGIVLQDPNPSLRDDAVENVLGVDYLLDSYGPFDNISDVTGSGAGNPVLDLAGGEVTTTTLNNEPIPWFTGGPGSSVSVPSGVTPRLHPGRWSRASARATRVARIRPTSVWRAPSTPWERAASR